MVRLVRQSSRECGQQDMAGKLNGSSRLWNREASRPLSSPPKNGLIALWSATNRWCVVKCVSQKRNRSNNKNDWYNILVSFIFKFISVYIRLIYKNSVISVNEKRLPGNTKKWTLVRSWLITVRLVLSWAAWSIKTVKYSGIKTLESWGHQHSATVEWWEEQDRPDCMYHSHLHDFSYSLPLVPLLSFLSRPGVWATFLWGAQKWRGECHHHSHVACHESDACQLADSHHERQVCVIACRSDASTGVRVCVCQSDVSTGMCVNLMLVECVCVNLMLVKLLIPIKNNCDTLSCPRMEKSHCGRTRM